MSTDYEARQPPTLFALCGRTNVRSVTKDNLPKKLRVLLAGSQVGRGEKSVLCPRCEYPTMQLFNLDPEGQFFRCLGSECGGVWRVG